MIFDLLQCSLFELTPNTFYSVVCFLFLQAITTISATVDSVLVYNKTGELPQRLLEQYPKITSLQATNLELTGLSQTFQTIHYQLKHLDLSHNHLSEFDNTFSFYGLRNLETLSLANNRLEKLESIDFYGLEKLQSLNLSHNRLQHLNAPVFDYVKEVRELKLDYNHLEQVNFTLFAKMVKRAILDLSNNQIKEIQYHPQYEQFGSHSLEHLYLGHNHLESFNFNEIPNFRNLTQLNLQGNNLTYLITGELVQRFPKLKTINISGHRLDSATLESFRTYSESNEIQLLSNSPEVMDHNNTIFKDLQGNNLTNLITGELVQQFQKLKTINISGHRLDSATLESIRTDIESNGIHLVLPPEEIDYTNAIIFAIAFFIIIIGEVTFGIGLHYIFCGQSLSK
jgi:Leucine-rich repeat (LRR) protein